jgi:hypothetical protein
LRALMLALFYPWGVILQALAIVHFIRRRPDAFWLWVILIGGGIGAFAYVVAEVLPDAALLRGTFNAFPRRKRIRQLEAEVLDNPSVGNFEELGDLLLEDKRYARARECFDRAITPRTATADPFYRRALAAIGLNDWPAAVTDLTRVAAIDPKYDYHRAAGLLAHALAQTGREEEALARFAEATAVSTLSETQYNYATLLAARGQTGEAREWVQRILNKKLTLPAFARRRERPWFRKASALALRLQKN